MVWLALTVAAIGLFLWLSAQGLLPANPIPHAEIPKLQAKSLAGLSLVVLALALAFDKAKVKSFEKLESARREAEQAQLVMRQLMTQLTQSIQAASSAQPRHRRQHRQYGRHHGQPARTLRGHGGDRPANGGGHQPERRAIGDRHPIGPYRRPGRLGGGAAMDQAVRQLSKAGEVIALASGRLEQLGERSAEVSGIVH